MMNKYYTPTGNWPLLLAPYQKLLWDAGFSQFDKEEADILVLTGGADIGMRPERDNLEFQLYQEWTAAQKPVLGICRGLQVMLHLNGGSMIQDIPTQTQEIIHTTISGSWKGQSSWHTTNLGLLTNSRHHQGFEQVPLGWNVIDKTDDGIVEAVLKDNQFAVQWHPEHYEMFNTIARDWWIEKARQIV